MWPSTTPSSFSATRAVAPPLDAGNAPGGGAPLVGISNVPPANVSTRNTSRHRSLLQKIYEAIIEVREKQARRPGSAREIARNHGVNLSTWENYWSRQGLTPRGVNAFVPGGHKAYREWVHVPKGEQTPQKFQQLLLKHKVDLGQLLPPTAPFAYPAIASVDNIDAPHAAVRRTQNGDIAALVLKAYLGWREQMRINEMLPGAHHVSFSEHANRSGVETTTFGTYFRADGHLKPRGVRVFVEGGEDAYREWQALEKVHRTPASFEAIVRRRGLNCEALRLKPRAAALARKWSGMSQAEQATFGTWRAFAGGHGLCRSTAWQYESLAIAPRTSASATPDAPPPLPDASDVIANTTPGWDMSPMTLPAAAARAPSPALPAAHEAPAELAPAEDNPFADYDNPDFDFQLQDFVMAWNV